MSNNLHRMYGATNSMQSIQQNRIINRAQPQQQVLPSSQIKQVILDQRHKDQSIDPSRFKMLIDTVSRNTNLERDKMWATRTNQPYKTILPSQDIKKEYKSQAELVVYKVNKADKDEIKFEENISQIKSAIMKHNNELNEVYAPSKESQCKREFEYNHVEKYRTKYNPADFKDMKDDLISHYKQEQHDMEKDIKYKDEILELLVASGMGESSTTPPTTNSPTNSPTNSSSQQSTQQNVDKYAQRQKKL